MYGFIQITSHHISARTGKLSLNKGDILLEKKVTYSIMLSYLQISIVLFLYSVLGCSWGYHIKISVIDIDNHSKFSTAISKACVI